MVPIVIGCLILNYLYFKILKMKGTLGRQVFFALILFLWQLAVIMSVMNIRCDIVIIHWIYDDLLFLFLTFLVTSPAIVIIQRRIFKMKIPQAIPVVLLDIILLLIINDFLVMHLFTNFIRKAF